ncbi:hypothetical protein [Streptomyces sp. MCC20]|uniref:hypothetical protein n=1 Tax=Streptomyces sediminimaris TaxID=3383721 RepID=UPI00399A36CC
MPSGELCGWVRMEDAVTVTGTSLSTILLAGAQAGAVTPGGWSLRTALGDHPLEMNPILDQAWEATPFVAPETATQP